MTISLVHTAWRGPTVLYEDKAWSQLGEISLVCQGFGLELTYELSLAHKNSKQSRILNKQPIGILKTNKQKKYMYCSNIQNLTFLL